MNETIHFCIKQVFFQCLWNCVNCNRAFGIKYEYNGRHESNGTHADMYCFGEILQSYFKRVKNVLAGCFTIRVCDRERWGHWDMATQFWFGALVYLLCKYMVSLTHGKWRHVHIVYVKRYFHCCFPYSKSVTENYELL